MGCDIHAYLETRPRGSGAGWEYQPDVEVFDCRSYSLFGWLADVRNYSAVPALVPNRGIPDDASEAVREELADWGPDAHSASWVSTAELLAFDYAARVEDRRVTVGNNGGLTAKPGEGEMTTYREFLGGWYFGELARLERLEESDETRVVFWFDN